jgi:hypothetical protein
MSALTAVRPYVQIARVDHWFKNAFMLLRRRAGDFLRAVARAWSSLRPLALALLATCLTASSNYVLNELLDGPTDKSHPNEAFPTRAVGTSRPGDRVRGVAGARRDRHRTVLRDQQVLRDVGGGLVAARRVVQRAADPHQGVAVPGRDQRIGQQRRPLLLGWFALLTTRVSAGVAAAVVLDGRRVLHGDEALRGVPAHRGPEVAAGYRKSFRHYTEEYLLLSIVFYATTSALFAGIFIVRYHLELILFVPFAAGCSRTTSGSACAEQPGAEPEKLYTERGFFAYSLSASRFSCC